MKVDTKEKTDAMEMIDQLIDYNDKMSRYYGVEHSLVSLGKVYASRAEQWQALKGRLERLEKLYAYLEQPGVLMSIPQPVRMMISRLLHEET